MSSDVIVASEDVVLESDKVAKSGSEVSVGPAEYPLSVVVRDGSAWDNVPSVAVLSVLVVVGSLLVTKLVVSDGVSSRSELPIVVEDVESDVVTVADSSFSVVVADVVTSAEDSLLTEVDADSEVGLEVYESVVMVLVTGSSM